MKILHRAAIAPLLLASLLPWGPEVGNPGTTSRDPGSRDSRIQDANHRPPDSYSLTWSIKFLYRGRHWMREVGVDQWARAVLEMARTDGSDDGHDFALIRPEEDPWILRWYPAKRELKLGTSIVVDASEIEGEPYATMAARLEPFARERSREWGADSFWRTCRDRKKLSTPRLAAEPTYPFYVLGSPQGRLRYRIDADGRVIPKSVYERMSEPWLAQGWEDALRGQVRHGTGFWKRERPQWEPTLYPALVQSIRWLGTQPDDGRFSIDLAEVAKFIETLNPQIAGRIDWHDRLTWNADGQSRADGAIRSDSGEQFLEDGSLVGRIRRSQSSPGTLPSDALTLTLADRHDGCTMNLEVRIGYAPSSPPDSDSSFNLRGSPDTNSPISSRTRR